MKKFYITTPLYYVNAPPHVGHAYTTLAADVLNRFKKMQGVETHFLTGTDEHGSKIERVAREAGSTPKAYADQIADQFQELWKHLDIRYDDFIRTTEPRHEGPVQKAFEELLKKGDIHKGTYRGYYCVSCETYWTDTEAPPDKQGRRLCPTAGCGKPLDRVEEESYFFRLSAYSERLLRHYQEHPEFLQPSHRAPEILRFVEGGLKDLSVSRTKVAWGVPVPSDPGHTIYVWFDALLNYITAVGFHRGSESLMHHCWPADVQLVGKEIFRFHAVIWPAMLMALGIALPKKVFAHGWWNFEGEKMSKSKGNVVDPREITREFGVDAFRYFLFREMPFGQDGTFSREALKKRYNAELANDLGNLLSRVVEMVDRYLGGELPPKPPPKLPFLNAETVKKNVPIAQDMEALRFQDALNKIWEVIRMLNRQVDKEAPWAKASSDPEGVKSLLFDLVWCLRTVAGWLAPFMPQTAAKIQSQLGVRQFPSPWTAEEVMSGAPSGTRIQKGPPLFPRK